MSEFKQAKKDGANLIKNSGRGYLKGDAVLGNLLIDYKETTKKSYSVLLSAFKKHEKDAWNTNKEPAVVVIFQEHNDKELAIVNWPWLREVLKNVAR